MVVVCRMRRLLIPLLALALIQCCHAQSGSQLLNLFQTIQGILLPASDIESDTPQQQRLVMLLPGKILNFRDYYPGDAYVNSLNNPDPNARTVNIPPRIQENMFRLSDVVAGVNPFAGGDTGESLSAIYRGLVSTMTVKGFDTLAADKKKTYQQAVNYLVEEVEDPMNENVTLPRLALYRRYQDIYEHLRRDTEDIIKERRDTMPAIEYELWFQRNYNILQAQVEGAYMEWLVYGRKELVETYRTQLETASPGFALLEARSVLRSSGVISLDRTQTVYPVTFTPSDWYRYINRTSVPMTRDQLQQRIADLEAQRLLIIMQRNFRPSETCDSTLNIALEAAMQARNDSEASINAMFEELKKDRCTCLATSLANSSIPKSEIPECQHYNEMLTTLEGQAREQGSASGTVDTINSLMDPTTDLDSFDQILQMIADEITDLQGKLAFAPKPPPDGANADVDAEPFDPNDKWLSFSYSSASDSTEETYSTYQSYTASYSTSSAGNWWASQGSAGSSSTSTTTSTSSSDSGSSVMNSVSNSNIVVKGKLLKVNIQRPWFRPDLFSNARLGLSDANTIVSPGPLAERDFIPEVLTSGKNYVLPQYITAFVLCRNIELEFTGVDKATSSSVMRSSRASSSSGGSSSGGWGPFGFSGRGDYSSAADYRSSSGSSFAASTTTSGMKIKIPGVQIIGYFNQVVKKFPITT